MCSADVFERVFFEELFPLPYPWIHNNYYYNTVAE